MDLSDRSSTGKYNVSATGLSQPCADTEANKTLEAALQQMEGIISG